MRYQGPVLSETVRWSNMVTLFGSPQDSPWVSAATTMRRLREGIAPFLRSLLLRPKFSKTFGKHRYQF